MANEATENPVADAAAAALDQLLKDLGVQVKAANLSDGLRLRLAEIQPILRQLGVGFTAEEASGQAQASDSYWNLVVTATVLEVKIEDLLAGIVTEIQLLQAQQEQIRETEATIARTTAESKALAGEDDVSQSQTAADTAITHQKELSVKDIGQNIPARIIADLEIFNRLQGEMVQLQGEIHQLHEEFLTPTREMLDILGGDEQLARDLLEFHLEEAKKQTPEYNEKLNKKLFDMIAKSADEHAKATKELDKPAEQDKEPDELPENEVIEQKPAVEVEVEEDKKEEEATKDEKPLSFEGAATVVLAKQQFALALKTANFLHEKKEETGTLKRATIRQSERFTTCVGDRCTSFTEEFHKRNARLEAAKDATTAVKDRLGTIAEAVAVPAAEAAPAAKPKEAKPHKYKAKKGGTV